MATWQMKAFRFGIVGLAQNATCYALTLVLVWAGLAAWQAVLLVNPIAVAVTFFVHRGWSFSDTGAKGQWWKYAVTYVLAYIYAVLFTWAQESVGIPSWLAIVVTTITAAGAIYVSLRLFVFRDNPGDNL
jgi:putative flippase GtrA